MHRLRMCVYLGLFAAALATMAFAPAQQPTGDPFSTEIRKIKDGLFVIPGYDGAVTGGNVAVRVTSEGTIIVDDRFPPSSKEIAGKVRSVTSQPIKYVLSTHSHGDHSGGHPEFIASAEIIAHRNNRANMIRNKQAAPPRVVFADQAAVFLGGVEVQAIHLGRGHTNGDAVIYFSGSSNPSTRRPSDGAEDASSKPATSSGTCSRRPRIHVPSATERTGRSAGGPPCARTDRR